MRFGFRSRGSDPFLLNPFLTAAAESPRVRLGSPVRTADQERAIRKDPAPPEPIAACLRAPPDRAPVIRAVDGSMRMILPRSPPVLPTWPRDLTKAAGRRSEK